MRRTPCLLALALVVGALAAPAAAADRTAPGGTALRPAGTVLGTVQEVVVERPGPHAGGDPEVRRHLVVDGRAVALPEGALPDNGPGDTVEVDLRAGRGGVAAVTRSRTVVRAAAGLRGAGTVTGASASEPALHEVYVALVDPRGPGGTHDADAVARAATLVERASQYWSSQTGGKVRFEVAQTLPAYTSQFSCGTDSAVLLWNEALDRFDAASGQVDTAYGLDKHLLVVLPDDEWQRGCDYGLGTIGGLHQEGNAVLVSDGNTSLYAHELGHNLGLNHSNALHCDTADAVPTSTTGGQTRWPAGRCYGEDYGDLLDVMGFSGEHYGEGSLNAVHLDRMGLSASTVRAVTGSTTATVELVPLSSTGTGTRTVVVTDSLGSRYYAEYRTATGRDVAALALEEAPALGVRVLREDPARRNGSYVLDPTPTGPVDDYDNDLPVGRTFTSVSGTVSFRVVAAGSTGATLSVTRTEPPASVSLAVPAAAAAGSPVSASVRVRDARGGTVATWPVALQVKPVGATSWQTIATATTGSTGSATFGYANGLSGAYRAVTAARPGAPARTSAVRTTTSSAAPTLVAPRSPVTQGAATAVTGTLRDVPARTVVLQARLGSGTWEPLVRAARDGATFTASTRLPRRGTWQLRYKALADDEDRYEAGYSAVRSVVVR